MPRRKPKPAQQFPEWFTDYLRQSLPRGYRIEFGDGDLHILPWPIKDVHGLTPTVKLYVDDRMWLVSDGGGTVGLLRRLNVPNRLTVALFDELNGECVYEMRGDVILNALTINGIYRDVSDLATFCVNLVNAVDAAIQAQIDDNIADLDDGEE